MKSRKVKPGQSIDYARFLELYKPYEDKMPEKDFAELLGINYANYRNLKYSRKVRVQDYRDKEKIDRIRHILKKEGARYYSKEEINEIAKRYEIDIDKMIKYILCAGKEMHVSNYTKVLEEKNKIWIGYTPCSKKFASSNSKIILQKAQSTSEKICSRYRCKHIMQDVSGDAIVYILQCCGDIDKNFSDEEEFAKYLIGAKISRFIKNRCFKSFSRRETSIYGTFTYKGDAEEINIFDRGIKDKTQNLQDEVEGNILLKEIKREQETNPEEACIKLLMINIESGLSREEVIAKTGKMLGVNPEEMLGLLKTYMIKNNKARETEDGAFILGE